MSSMIRRAALMSLPAFALVAGSQSAQAGVLGPAVFVTAAPVVVEYHTYVVGYRRNLYDADWHLRRAQADMWNAQERLDAARQHVGEIAIAIEDQEGLITKYGKSAEESEAIAANARVRLVAHEKRVSAAREYLEASRTLNDDAGVADAEDRIRKNEAGAAAAAAELREAGANIPTPEVRAQIAEARAQLPRMQEDFAAAHEQAFFARQRVDAAQDQMAVAMHDRDEALWLLHRDEILAGRAEFRTVGFHIDLGHWGGRHPRDIEQVRAYYVRPVSYWREHPVELETRMAELDQVSEIATIHDIQRTREPEYRNVVVVEERMTPEVRRARAERVVVERERFVSEEKERKAAVAEHRAPRIDPVERAEAKAIVTKSRADAQATKIEARGDAQEKRAEGHAAVIDARADAQKKQAETQMERKEAHAQVEATRKEGQAEAHAKQEEAHANNVATRKETQADIAAKNRDSKAEAQATRTEARSDAKSKEIAARADAKDKAKNDAKPDPRNANNGKDPKDTRASTEKDNRGNSKESAARGGKNDSRDNKDDKNKDNRSADNGR